MKCEPRSSVGRLAAILGLQLGVESDEHGRWTVYRSALEESRVWDALLAAVREELDVIVAAGVVLEMLERIPEDQATVWIDVLPEGSRERKLAIQRAGEVFVFRALESGSRSVVSSEVDGWTDWLQRRLAERAQDQHVLAELAQFGRTRRVRALSAERARREAGSVRPEP